MSLSSVVNRTTEQSGEVPQSDSIFSNTTQRSLSFLSSAKSFIKWFIRSSLTVTPSCVHLTNRFGVVGHVFTNRA
eukprot:12928396-Prorocentrum_lima.AAC.1